jgi:hypothetical protein
LVQYKGVENLDGEVNKAKQLLIDMEIEDYPSDQYLSDQYFTQFGQVDGTQTIAILNNQSTLYSITKSDIFNKPKESSAFSFDDRLSGSGRAGQYRYIEAN